MGVGLHNRKQQRRTDSEQKLWVGQAMFPKQLHTVFRIAFNVSYGLVETQQQCVFAKTNIKFSKDWMEPIILRNNKDKERLLSYFQIQVAESGIYEIP